MNNKDESVIAEEALDLGVSSEKAIKQSHPKLKKILKNKRLLAGAAVALIILIVLFVLLLQKPRQDHAGESDNSQVDTGIGSVEDLEDAIESIDSMRSQDQDRLQELNGFSETE